MGKGKVTGPQAKEEKEDKKKKTVFWETHLFIFHQRACETSCSDARR
jgi:hypothetical protein